MPFNVSINNKEIKNPIVRLLVFIVAFIFFVMVLAIMFLLLLPLLWLAAMLYAFVLSVFLLALIQSYRRFYLGRKNGIKKT